MKFEKNLLTVCDKEPIHIPGAIQPYGFLFCVDTTTGEITKISSNSEYFFDMKPQEMLGRNITELFTSQNIKRAIKPIYTTYKKERRLRYEKIWIQSKDGEIRYFDALLHYQKGEAVVELMHEKGLENQISYSSFDAISLANSLCSSTSTKKELIELIPKLISDITGYCRVMLYQFDEEFNGSVISEHRNSNAQTSYLGLHFPSSDIPAQARELYRTNLIRVIPNIHYEPSKILSTKKYQDELFDMSYSALRSVSPVHIEYLKNMEVESSMSLSLVYKGELWGMIACHGLDSRYIPLSLWSGLEIVAELLATNIVMRQNIEKLLEIKDMQAEANIASNLFNEISKRDSIENSFSKIFDFVLNFSKSSGVAIVLGKDGDDKIIRKYKLTPNDKSILELIERVGEISSGEFKFVTDRAYEDMPSIGEFKSIASGIYLSKLPSKIDAYFMLFKEEYKREILWAGDKDEMERKGAKDGVISPRKSFNAWIESIENRSSPWSDEVVSVLDKLLLEISKDIDVSMFEHEIESARLEREKNEQLLIQNVKMAEMGEMIGAITHQWNQPLTVLKLVGETLQDRFQECYLDRDRQGEESEQAKDLIKIYNEQIKYMEQTIYDFSRFFKKDNKNLTSYLYKALDDVKNIMQPSMKQHKIELKLSIKFDKNIRVYGISNELKQVFMILLSNSRDAINSRVSKERGFKGEIEIIDFVDDNFIEVSIVDNGGGIDSDYLDRVFDAYVSSKGDKGTGIGLYIAKLIVCDHAKGEIFAENFKEGAKFTVRLKRES